MKVPTAALALPLVLSALLAQAQTYTGVGNTPPPRRSPFNRGGATPSTKPPAAPRTVTTAPTTSAATRTPRPDNQVFKSNQSLPEPVALDEIEGPKIPLPTEPIEPYLLTKNNGPFMVLAYTFRGPDAARYAQALAIELRSKHRLPAYVFSLRIHPGHGNIRNVPPTAPDEIQSDESVTPPARFRIYDEAAVLVGDCKSIDESEKVLHEVKKIHSDVVDGLPSIFAWRKGKGLSRATLTTNPMVPTQKLYSAQGDSHAMVVKPGQVVDPSILTAGFERAEKPDPLLKRMNASPNSVYKCPGPYTLQVAEFAGRTSIDPNDPLKRNDSLLRNGKLAAAADQAETLANSLTKLKTLDKRYKPYVFHDRYASRVYLGAFQSAADPSLKVLLEAIAARNGISDELLNRKFTELPLAPASELTPVPRP
jgi:hypothetical protein